MDLLAILAGAGAVVLFVGIYRAGVHRLNERSQAKHGYKPINVMTCIIATSAYAVMLIGTVMGGDNVTTGVFAGLCLFALAFVIVGIKSSLPVALLSLPLLAIAGLGVIVVVLLLYLILGQKKKLESANK